MRIINDGIPQIFYNAITKSQYKPNPDTIGVTRLIGPPLIRQLEIKEWDNIVINASEFLWPLFGQAMHYAILKGAPKESLTEERLEVTTAHGTVVGKPDLYVDQNVYDLKVTSVWAYILGDHKEWEAQLNTYSWLLIHYGFEINNLYIDLLFKDWQKVKTYQNNDYPSIQSVEIKIPKWTSGKTESYITDRLKLHTLPAEVCTPRERWTKQTTYAVKTNGRKSALRVLNSSVEAEEWAKKNTKKPFTVEIRSGEFTRCKGHCMVRSVCPYNPYQGNNNGD